MPDVLGVDWGGTRFRVGLVSFRRDAFQVSRVSDLAWSSRQDPESDADWAAAVCSSVAGPDVPVGVALAGFVDSRSGRVFGTPNMPWRLPEDGFILGRRLGRPALVVNDVNAAAWAEAQYGAGRGGRAVLAFFLGTGLGAGFVEGGRILEGAHGLGLELGHLRVRPGGRRCGCGGRGCVEAYVGGRALEARILEEAPSESLVWTLGGARPHAGHADEAARRGDAWARSFVVEAAQLLAWALGSAVTLLDPDVVVAGGSVWLGCPFLRARVTELLSDFVSGRRAPGIETARLGDVAGIVGAADLARRRLT